MASFVDFTTPGYQFGWFNRDICNRLDVFLERVLRGESPRMMLFAPPRHGKSEIVSRKFPAYALGRAPHIRVIGTSYSADLANALNRDVQRVIDDDLYRAVFPATTLAPRGAYGGKWVRRSDLFNIVDHAGGYRSAGVGGGITGMGGHILLIDDPIKDQAEAMSQTIRDSVWDWYRTTFYTRQAPGAGILLIMTRWHTDDPAGRLIEAAKAGGEAWEIVSYPAIAETEEPHRKIGEPLHPERYSLPALRRIEAAVGASAWSALYQQRPVSRQGAMFNRRWFEIVPAAPIAKRKVRSWDLAATSGGGDWTAGLLMSVDADGYYYIEHVERFRGSPLEVRRSVKAHASADGRRVPIRLPKDGGQAGKDQAEGYVRELAGWTVHTPPETGSKEVRAMPFAAQCEARNVRLVAGAWNENFLDELENFPNGAHDDQVDAASGAFERLTLAPVIKSSIQELRM